MKRLIAVLAAVAVVAAAVGDPAAPRPARRGRDNVFSAATLNAIKRNDTIASAGAGTTRTTSSPSQRPCAAASSLRPAGRTARLTRRGTAPPACTIHRRACG